LSVASNPSRSNASPISWRRENDILVAGCSLSYVDQ
jgi:hypothetical protein